jgi:serine/threonine protein kinase
MITWIMTKLHHVPTSVVACLESFGLAHSGIKPANILVDEQDQLKLIDLDHTKPIGSDVEVGDDPYVRVYKVENPVAVMVWLVLKPNILP